MICGSLMIFHELRSSWFASRNYHALRILDRTAALAVALLWPPITGVQSARRAAGYGIVACLLVAGEWPFPHFAWPHPTDPIRPALLALEFPLGIALATVWLGLAWGISAMSRAASLGALLLYLAMRAERSVCLLHDGRAVSSFEIGISALVVLMLANSVRGALAYRGQGAA